jgi:hypothetical protein
MHSQVLEDATLFEQHEMADVLQFQKRMKSEDGYGKLLKRFCGPSSWARSTTTCTK